MRIWDLPCQNLCDKHLLAEHRELHAIFIFLTTDKGNGYRKHPETLRWIGREYALYLRHEQQKKEFLARGWKHKSEILLTEKIKSSLKTQNLFIHSISEQIAILKNKNCKCILINNIKL